MKIDLKKLQEVSLQFQFKNLPGELEIENTVAQFTLHKMVEVVLNYDESSYGHAPSNVKMAFETLLDLGIIKLDDAVEPKVQQLNS